MSQTFKTEKQRNQNNKKHLAKIEKTLQKLIIKGKNNKNIKNNKKLKILLVTFKVIFFFFCNYYRFQNIK